MGDTELGDAGLGECGRIGLGECDITTCSHFIRCPDADNCMRLVCWEMNQREIGCALGISKARVGQIEAAALRKLKRALWGIFQSEYGAGVHRMGESTKLAPVNSRMALAGVGRGTEGY